MGNVVDGQEGAQNHSSEGSPFIGLPIYLIHRERGVIQPLNVPARNAMVHKSPALVKHAVAEAFQRRANKKGSYEDTDCVVHWKPSAIPFHIRFEIFASNNTCQHLASVRNIKAKDPDQYAKSLIPLAKVFLSNPPGSHLPHLPFIRPQIPSDHRSNREAEDKQTAETIQHARLINDKHKSLNEIDISTAEATSKMVNAGKIFSGLLVYLTTPKPRIEDVNKSAKPPTTEDKSSQATKGPLLAASKRPNPVSSADELEQHGPLFEHNRRVPCPEDDIDGVKVTQKPTLEENSAPEDTSAVGKMLPEEPTATVRSSKGGKASKKSHQGRKQLVDERIRNGATFTVSAYPTQRPPRKNRARKSSTTTESSQWKTPEPEECDLEQVSATLPPPLERSNNEGNSPAQFLKSEASSQKDGAFQASASVEYKESKAHTAEQILGSETMGTEDDFFHGDFVNGDDLITAACKPIDLSPPTKPIQMHGSGVQGLLWAYAINAMVDETLGDAGIWIWRQPETYFHFQPLFRKEEFRHSVLAPVVVSHERNGVDEPTIEFDGEMVHVVPQEQCWEDVRSHESHPDFLSPWKLAEYQACEAAGYKVWQHDRDLLVCRLPGCDASVSDYHHSAIVCLGCGPKSIVRYCSSQHRLEDIGGHWKECGTWRVYLQGVIDHTTAPTKFARMCPAIRQRHGSRTAALHHQKLYCALAYGHYTLFDPASNRSETLCWPKQDPKWPQMDRRIERLLNVAFLDSWNHYVLGYIYRLLREVLRHRGEWSKITERILKLQIEAEFCDYNVNTNWHNGDAPCECEWSGKILPRYDHLPTCKEYAPIADDYGPIWRPNCIEATVEDYEERFWILRAWRQQHPTQNNWRLRAAGHGFPDMKPDEGCYKLGPGWTGWGAERDNMCEDQGDHGEKGSTRSA